MNTAGKRALITGIHGFTGRYMAAELEASGYEVIRLNSHLGNVVGYYQADLSDID
jgi:GDP-D-mannose dehydratase